MIGEPLVTITALCFNHSPYVLETLESILDQSYPCIEVIIIDDCSADDSVQKIERWLSEKKLAWQFLKHKKNIGVSKSLNESLRIAKGKYYKAIACDDVLMPDFVRYMANRFEDLPDSYALLYSDVLTINEQSEVVGTTPFAERGWINEQQIPSGKIFHQLAGWCFIPAPGTMMKTDAVGKIGFDESLLFEDWDMWLQLSKRYEIKGVPVALVKYRIHQRSMQQSMSPKYRDHILRVMEKHLGYDNMGDEILKDYIYRESLRHYLNRGERLLYWQWKRFTINKSLKNFARVALAMVGYYPQRVKAK